MSRNLPALLRLAAIACAVLAVAAPAAPVPRPADRTTIFVLDVSPSVAPATLREAVAAIEAASAKERVGVVIFGAEAELLVPPQSPPLNIEARLIERFRAPDVERPDADRYAVEFRRPDPDFSNVRAAMALAASTGADRVILMTDGRVEAVTADRVVPLRSDWSDDAIAVDLEAPPAVREGEPFDVVLRARAGRDVEATAVLTVDHEVVADDVPIRLRGGQDTLVTFRGLVGPDRQGLHTIRVYIRHDDPRPRNNRAAACVFVRGKPRALLIADDPLPFDRVLKGQGFEVERVGLPAVASAKAGAARGVGPDASCRSTTSGSRTKTGLRLHKARRRTKQRPSYTGSDSWKPPHRARSYVGRRTEKSGAVLAVRSRCPRSCRW